jgi:trehalose 6-phosphate synthase/phosphatase
VEVKHVWATKASVVQELEAAGEPPDLRIALGDDRTDEDLFAALPADAWTVHVGSGASQARFCLRDPGEVRRLLEALAA